MFPRELKILMISLVAHRVRVAPWPPRRRHTHRVNREMPAANPCSARSPAASRKPSPRSPREPGAPHGRRLRPRAGRVLARLPLPHAEQLNADRTPRHWPSWLCSPRAVPATTLMACWPCRPSRTRSRPWPHCHASSPAAAVLAACHGGTAPAPAGHEHV